MITNPADDKVYNCFGDLAVDKKRVAESSIASTGLPRFVAEWIVTSLAPGIGALSEDEKSKIARAVELAPGRNSAPQIKDRLMSGQQVEVIDIIDVDVILGANERRVASLLTSGLNDCDITDTIMDRFGPSLLEAGMWGKVTLSYQSRGRPTVVRFDPLQSRAQLGLLSAKRPNFTLSEWRDLLVASCGWNPSAYSLEAKGWLLARLLPLVQRNYHLIELAPKGTGKSFLFENLTQFVRLVPGGDVTAAQLIINNQSRRRGLLGRFDVLVFDELEQVRFKDEEEIIASLKAYTANGQASRGGSSAYASECSLLFMGNIPLNSDLQPAQPDYIGEASRYLQGPSSDALLDRFAGVIPGWEIPKFTPHSQTKGAGLKLDFLVQSLREMRKDVSYEQYVRERVPHPDATGGPIRDYNAVVATCSGYLKLLFPDRGCTKAEFAEFCLAPAVRLRQAIRSALYAREAEYRRQPELLEYNLRPDVPYGSPRQIVDGYEILDVIGEGGMGRVYRAKAPDGSLVAIKLSTADITSQDHGFRREVEIANRLFQQGLLRHVIRVIDLIRMNEKNALVLEYADGGSLEDYLKSIEQRDKAPLDTKAVRKIAESVLLGLDELHSAAEPIIHRDIKPGNVLRVLGTWKVADFGTSRFDRRAPATKTLAAFRTPGYSPPDVIAGKASDIFSFARLIVRVLAGDPLAPLPSWVPLELSAILSKCQQVNPADRPQSAREVFDALSPIWEKLVVRAPG